MNSVKRKIIDSSIHLDELDDEIPLENDIARVMKWRISNHRNSINQYNNIEYGKQERKRFEETQTKRRRYRKAFLTLKSFGYTDEQAFKLMKEK